MVRVRQYAELYLPIAQEKARWLADKTEEVSQKVAEPVISMHAKSAQVKGIRQAIFTRRQKS
jgi:hypothetical protein